MRGLVWYVKEMALRGIPALLLPLLLLIIIIITAFTVKLMYSNRVGSMAGFFGGGDGGGVRAHDLFKLAPLTLLRAL